MAESEEVKGETTKKGKPRKVGHIKMMVMADLKSATVTELVEQNVSDLAKIDSDDSTSYTNLTDVVKEHNPKVVAKKRYQQDVTLGSYCHQQCQTDVIGCLSSHRPAIYAKLPQRVLLQIQSTILWRKPI